jgi:hypothetical protein
MEAGVVAPPCMPSHDDIPEELTKWNHQTLLILEVIPFLSAAIIEMY